MASSRSRWDRLARLVAAAQHRDPLTLRPILTTLTRPPRLVLEHGRWIAYERTPPPMPTDDLEDDDPDSPCTWCDGSGSLQIDDDGVRIPCAWCTPADSTDPADMFRHLIARAITLPELETD